MLLYGSTGISLIDSDALEDRIADVTCVDKRGGAEGHGILHDKLLDRIAGLTITYRIV